MYLKYWFLYCSVSVLSHETPNSESRDPNVFITLSHCLDQNSWSINSHRIKEGMREWGKLFQVKLSPGLGIDPVNSRTLPKLYSVLGLHGTWFPREERWWGIEKTVDNRKSGRRGFTTRIWPIWIHSIEDATQPLQASLSRERLEILPQSRAVEKIQWSNVSKEHGKQKINKWHQLLLINEKGKLLIFWPSKRSWRSVKN